MLDHRDAVDDIDDLIFHKRRSGEEGDDVPSFARTLDQRVAISAAQPAKGDDTGEMVAFDPSGAPEVAKRIAFQLLEEDERTELLVRLRRHPWLRSYFYVRIRIPPVSWTESPLPFGSATGTSPKGCGRRTGICAACTEERQ